MRHLLPPALLLLAACGGDAASAVLATRADSAGIEIVTNTGQSWRDGDGWQIDPDPILTVSPREDADPRYEILRATAGRLLPTGELLVLVGGHFELRVYGTDGEWVRSIGRAGDGPGEMRSPSALAVAGDTIFLVDQRLSRISAFSLAGNFLTSWPMPQIDSGGRVPPGYRLSDGRWVGGGTASFTAGEVSEGVSRVPLAWYRISADLSRVEDTLVTTPGTERSIIIQTGGAGEITMMQVVTLPVGRSSPVTVGGDRFWTGDTERPEVRRYTPDGMLATLVRWNAPAAVLEPSLFEQMKGVALAGREDDGAFRNNVEARFKTSPPGTPMPFFAGLHLDAMDNLWVREFTALPTDSIRFKVFDPEGQWLGQLALPPRHMVLAIGQDRLLTVWQDDDDVEHIRVYRIVR